MRTYYWITFIIVTLGVLLGVATFMVQHCEVDFARLAYYNPGCASVVLDDEGNELARFELDRRAPIMLCDIPLHVQQAFITAEDRNFFTHPGISWRSIIRSLFVNMYHCRKMQGASTITQQLVKLLFFDCRKNFVRKIKEQVYALLIEQQFSKEQILQTYLNHVCFGCGIYGIQAAAQRFWGISVHQLSIAQAAALAAIVNQPARYCPLMHPAAPLARRNWILAGMASLGYITAQQCADAKKEPLVVQASYGMNSYAPHVKEALRQMLEQLVGKHELYTGGLVIQTTINRAIQQKAHESFVQQCQLLRQQLHPSMDGALLTVAVSTGEIKALIGGCDFKESQFNRALQARRQLGSIIKPLIYAAAIMQGRNFAEVEIDEPVEFTHGTTVWSPRNSSRTFEGPMTLARALSYSNNIIAIKTLLRTGIERVITLAHKCHLSADMPAYPSLALGCTDVTLKEAVGLFNIFANDGVYVEPHLVSWIKDRWGAKIYRYMPVRERVVPSRVAGQVTKVLGIGIDRYMTRMNHDDFVASAIGKTGTTNDARTCWFVGSTPRLTTGVYVGRDDNKALGEHVFPVGTAFPMWFQLHKAVDNCKGNFIVDPTLKEVLIDWNTGACVGSPCADTVTIYQ